MLADDKALVVPATSDGIDGPQSDARLIVGGCVPPDVPLNARETGDFLEKGRCNEREVTLSGSLSESSRAVSQRVVCRRHWDTRG